VSENPVKVFVTYCWSPEAHQQKVFKLVDRLRADGFFAEQDLDIMGRENNIQKMMTIGFGYDKVIVVLSEGYKKSADSNTGGVGQEAPMIAAMKTSYPEKFVFVCLDTLSKTTVDRVCPHLFAGENIIDLTSTKDTDGYNLLYAKLYDEPLVDRDPVLGPRKPVRKVHAPGTGDEAPANRLSPIHAAAVVIAKHKILMVAILCVVILLPSWLFYSIWSNGITLVSSRQVRVINDVAIPLNSKRAIERIGDNDTEKFHRFNIPNDRYITSAHPENRFIETDFVFQNRSRNSEIIKSANIVVLEHTPDPHAIIEYHFSYDTVEHDDKYMIDNISVFVTNKGFGDAYDCTFTIDFIGTAFHNADISFDELRLGETKELCVISKEDILDDNGSSRTNTQLGFVLNYAKAKGDRDELHASLRFRNSTSGEKEHMFIENGSFWLQWTLGELGIPNPLEPQTKYLCILNSDDMAGSSGAFIKEYPTLVRVFSADGFDRFALHLGATKSCKLRFRVDFVLANNRTISSEVFEGSVYLLRLYTEKDSIIDTVSGTLSDEMYYEEYAEELYAYPTEKR